MPEVISAPKYTDELLQLFREKGLALTMDEIAARLHLSKKTLYNIFTSKRGMVKAVMERFLFNMTFTRSLLQVAVAVEHQLLLFQKLKLAD